MKVTQATRQTDTTNSFSTCACLLNMRNIKTEDLLCYPFSNRAKLIRENNWGILETRQEFPHILTRGMVSYKGECIVYNKLSSSGGSGSE